MFRVPNGSLIHVPVVGVTSTTYVRLPVTTTFRRGRIYFFFGLQGGPNQVLWPAFPIDAIISFVATYTLTLVNLFLADGWEIILSPDPADFVDPGPDIPGQWRNALVNPEMRDDPTLGAHYTTVVIPKSFDNLVTRVNADWGWLPSGVGGESWGAYTACQLAVNRPILSDGTPMIGFFGGICPTQVGQVINIGGLIWPFSTAGADLATASGNNPAGPYTSTFLNGVRIPGRVTFGNTDVTVYPGGASEMVRAALAAGAPLASRYTDGTISGGTSFSSTNFCLPSTSSGANEQGCVITGPGIPAGTTLSSIVDTGGGGQGPWTGTLSQACTNSAPIAITAVSTTATTVTYTAAGHGFSVGERVCVDGFSDSNSAADGVRISPSAFNITAKIISATTNTFTVTSTAGLTVPGTVLPGQFGQVSAAFNFPGLAPAYQNSHLVLWTENQAIPAWWAEVLDPSYPMVL